VLVSFNYRIYTSLETSLHFRLSAYGIIRADAGRLTKVFAGWKELTYTQEQARMSMKYVVNEFLTGIQKHL